jgi:glucokinase
MNLNPRFKLYLPGIESEKNNNISIIGANIHENKTVLGLFISENQSLVSKGEKEYNTEDFSSFSDILKLFLSETPISGTKRLGIAVPGPVINGKSSPERIGWDFDAEIYQREFGFEKVDLINDIEAIAYGMAFLDDQDLISVHHSDTPNRGNVAILAPGNGLGEAGYFFDGKNLRPFATEGGHSEFSPRTTVEVEFYQFLNNIYGIVSWENVLSKKGLFNIYRFLRDVKQHPQPEWLTQRFANGDFVEELYKAAVEENVLICKIALNTYIEFLAREANSLTLKLKAIGGLLITGSIPSILRDYMDKDKFYEKYKISDKMEYMFKDVPIYLVESKDSELIGSAVYAAFMEE